MPTIASCAIRSFLFNWVKIQKTDTVVKHLQTTKVEKAEFTQRRLPDLLSLVLCYLLWLANLRYSANVSSTSM